MKREEFLLGVTVYALIIAAGYAGPILKKLKKFPWNKPVQSFAWGPIRDSVAISGPGDKKALLALKVRQALTPDRSIPEPVIAQDSIRQNLEERWKRMASHPALFGTGSEPSSLPRPLLGIKTGSKPKLTTPGKKAQGVEEPMKS
jgi:hypothetical protein